MRSASDRMRQQNPFSERRAVSPLLMGVLRLSGRWVWRVDIFRRPFSMDSDPHLSQLEKSISDYIANLNKIPKRFVWKADGIGSNSIKVSLGY